jgi:hypothetical protein
LSDPSSQQKTENLIVDITILYSPYSLTNFFPKRAYNVDMSEILLLINQTVGRMGQMDEQFIKRLHTLNRRDELRSRLLIDGVKLTLKRKKELGLLDKFFKDKKKSVIAKGWN